MYTAPECLRAAHTVTCEAAERFIRAVRRTLLLALRTLHKPAAMAGAGAPLLSYELQTIHPPCISQVETHNVSRLVNTLPPQTHRCPSSSRFQWRRHATGYRPTPSPRPRGSAGLPQALEVGKVR